MTEHELLQVADRPDWWMGPDGPRDGMRTLRAALEAVALFQGRAFLFRPSGEGAPALWLSAEEIEALRTTLRRSAGRAA